MYVTNAGLGERPPVALDGWHFGEGQRLAIPARSVDIYISVEGTKQGKFKGETSMVKGPTGQSRVLKFSYGVGSPRDVFTGQASGKRQHKPIVITREPGAASPQFYGAGDKRSVEASGDSVPARERYHGHHRSAGDYQIDQRQHFRLPAIRSRRWSLAGRCGVYFSPDTDRKQTRGDDRG
jgi:hypothetical protein